MCQEDFCHKIWGALPIIVRGMYRVGCLLLNRLTFLLISLYRRPFFDGIQADLSFTPQISFADSSNFQSVMFGCIRPRNIQGPDKGDLH